LLGFPVSVVSCFLFLLLFLLDTLLLSVSSRLIILNMQCLKGNYGGYLLGTLRLNNFAPHEVWDSVYDTLHDVIAQTYGDLLGLRGCNDALILIINGKPTSIVSVNQEDSGLRRRLPCLCVSACHKKEGDQQKGSSVYKAMQERRIHRDFPPSLIWIQGALHRTGSILALMRKNFTTAAMCGP
jgi:hypothetical protein